MQTGAASNAVGLVSTQSTGLNVRSAGSTGSGIVASLARGSHVRLIRQDGSWWQVEYAKGKYGYCHSDFITVKQTSEAVVKLNSGTLNVRTGPATSFSAIGSLCQGERVQILQEHDGWSKVVYHGSGTGYVSSRYLSSGADTGATIEKLELAVPGYLQMDSRWANVTLGNSGKTMAQIGCATTAIAMMESYRLGMTIQPNVMESRLRYTSSGSVYWPEHYTQVSDLSGYLSRIYSLLIQGKPVLLGAKNSSGRQHWVVVTGFTGGDALTAQGFRIQDPGSSTRTDLQQFLDSYPALYKYFHY